MDGAFVTGGSGFIGGRLIERLVAEGVRVRALARSRALGRQGARARRRAGRRRPRRRRRARPRARAAARSSSTPPRTSRTGATRRTSTASTCSARGGSSARRGRPARGGSSTSGPRRRSWRASRSIAVDETEPLRPRSPALYSRTKALAEIEVLTAPPGIETVSSGRGSSGAAATRRCCPRWPRWCRAGKFAWAGGGTPPDRDDARRQHRRGADARRDARAATATRTSSPTARRSPFREIVTRLLETQGLDPGDRNDPGAGRPRGRASPARRAWRALPLPGAPAADPLRLVDHHARVHALDREGAPRARLRAGRLARGGARGAEPRVEREVARGDRVPRVPLGRRARATPRPAPRGAPGRRAAAAARRAARAGRRRGRARPASISGKPPTSVSTSGLPNASAVNSTPDWSISR